MTGPTSDHPTFDIEYKAGDGEVTARRITIHASAPEPNDLYLTAFCHLRGERRDFRTSQILSMRDVLTGAVIPSPIAHLEMYPHLLAPHPQGGPRTFTSPRPRRRGSFQAPQAVSPGSLRASNLDIHLLLTFRNEQRGSFGPHRVRLSEARPMWDDFGGSWLTLVLHFLDWNRIERRNINHYSIEQAADADTGELLPDLVAHIAERASRPDLLNYGTTPTR